MARRPPTRRTVRKNTRFTEEEWNVVDEAAGAANIPPLRYVREAALGRPPQPSRERHSDQLVHQLARILNNLQQLRGIAETTGADASAAMIAETAAAVEAKLKTMGALGREAAARIMAAVVPAGSSLNTVAHQANSLEELPADEEVLNALSGVKRSLEEMGEIPAGGGARP
jgi:hypothetical protein